MAYLDAGVTSLVCLEIDALAASLPSPAVLVATAPPFIRAVGAPRPLVVTRRSCSQSANGILHARQLLLAARKVIAPANTFDTRGFMTPQLTLRRNATTPLKILLTENYSHLAAYLLRFSQQTRVAT